jgi:hypothetical protein
MKCYGDWPTTSGRLLGVAYKPELKKQLVRRPAMGEVLATQG